MVIIAYDSTNYWKQRRKPPTALFKKSTTLVINSMETLFNMRAYSVFRFCEKQTVLVSTSSKRPEKAKINCCSPPLLWAMEHEQTFLKVESLKIDSTSIYCWICAGGTLGTPAYCTQAYQQWHRGCFRLALLDLCLPRLQRQSQLPALFTDRIL